MEQDKELKAINEIFNALNDLDEESKKSAIKYVLGRLNVNFEQELSQLPQTQIYKKEFVATDERVKIDNAPLVDIRALKEDKNPRSDIQMAVLLAYYLKEKAPTGERSEIIGSEDILRYFPQAGRTIPEGKNGPSDTLNNAKRAGYLEAVGGGKYKLNAVGYNLAAFKMGNQNDDSRKGKSKLKKKIGKNRKK